MQYKYVEVELPSNGLIYDTKRVHLRAKTIFDIRTLLNNPVYYLKSEIDALQNCINPDDKINVYDLVNQDVVYLLYKLRSMSSDTLTLNVNNKEYHILISELDVKKLEEWNPDRILPDSELKVTLSYNPIKNVFEIEKQQQEFIKKYPDYNGDVLNTVTLLNAITMIDGKTDKDHIRNILEGLSFKDAIYLVKEIEQFQHQDFGVIEEVELDIDDKKVKVPIQITEEFFLPAL